MAFSPGFTDEDAMALNNEDMKAGCMTAAATLIAARGTGGKEIDPAEVVTLAVALYDRWRKVEEKVMDRKW